MSDERTNKQKHDFLLAAMKMGLQHFDAGGGVSMDNSVGDNAKSGAQTGGKAGAYFGPVGAAAGVAGGAVVGGAAPLIAKGVGAAGSAIGKGIGAIPGAIQDVSKAFTPQNKYNAEMAQTANSDYGGTINAASQNSLNAAQGMNSALGQQQGFLDQLRAQNGVGNQSSVFNQMQGVANGQGPNPAQAMLNQATGNNISAQAAMMAGQRGAGANAGLIAREAAQQGGNMQQQAAGQAATLQANQSLNALNNMGNIAQQQVGNQQAAQSGLQSGYLGQQGASNQLFTGAAGAQNAQNANDIQNLNNAQTINAATAQNNTNATTKTMGGLMGGMSSMIGGGALKGLLAEGGMIPSHFDDGGYVAANGRNVVMNPGGGTLNGVMDTANGKPDKAGDDAEASEKGGPGEAVGGAEGGSGASAGAGDMGLLGGAGETEGGAAGGAGLPVLAANGGEMEPNGQMMGPQSSYGKSLAGHKAMPVQHFDGGGGVMKLLPLLALLAKGGKVPALVSPGEVYLTPQQAQEAAKGRKDPIRAGERIPGKPKYAGNNYANDTVPKKLSPGGVVIPNAVMQSKNPHAAAKKFLAAVMAKQHIKKGKK